MKIAVASEDGAGIAQHFGRSTCFLVFETAEGGLRQLETRPAAAGCASADHGHGVHGEGETAAHHDHSTMVDPIADCDILLCAGIGRAAVEALAMRGIIPVGAPPEMPPMMAAQLAADGRLGRSHGCNCTCGH